MLSSARRILSFYCGSATVVLKVVCCRNQRAHNGSCGRQARQQNAIIPEIPLLRHKKRQTPSFIHHHHTTSRSGSTRAPNMHIQTQNYQSWHGSPAAPNIR